MFGGPPKLIEHLGSATSERVPQVLDREIGGIAGMLEILVAPFHVTTLEWCVGVTRTTA
ncbi:MAG: hypothetical protein WED27_01150 [Pirellulales bacterium]